MKRILIVALCASGLISAGCRKEKETGNIAATATNGPQAELPAAGAPGTGGARVPVAGPVPVKNASELDRALSNWVARNRRTPTSFEEFAASPGINIPPPPDGRRYAIDKTGHVVLVKR